MSKHALLAATGFFAIGFAGPALRAQGLNENQPLRITLSQADAVGSVEPFSAQGRRLFGTLSSAWYGPAALTLADGRLFSFPSAFAWIEAAPANFIPAATLAGPPSMTPGTATVSSGSTGKPVDLLPRFDYVGSEVGVFYGKSTGKYGREVKAGYILSEIVEGETHISVGMSYQDSSGRRPRPGR